MTKSAVILSSAPSLHGSLLHISYDHGIGFLVGPVTAREVGLRMLFRPRLVDARLSRTSAALVQLLACT